MPRVNETFSEGSNHHMYLLTVDVVWVIGQKRAFFSILTVTGFRISEHLGKFYTMVFEERSLSKLKISTNSTHC